VLPEMVKREDGVILLVSSIGGMHGSAVLGTYGVSKAADLCDNLSKIIFTHLLLDCLWVFMRKHGN
jgi:NADP-dependent 3-hydroxy acid dehydrogenase YdfG